MKRIKVVSWLLWLSALALSILPMVETLNDLVALLAMRLGGERLLMGFAPMAARYIAATLRYIFGVPVTVYGPSIYLEMGGVPLEVYLDWNCLGWQGFLLMVFALFVALQGDYTTVSKVKGALLGLEVFAAANAARILIPCLLLIHGDYRLALLFHNYLATPLILSFIALYWHLCTRYILQPKEGEETGGLGIKELLTGRRGIGLASMAIILLAIFYSGIGFLSAGVEAAEDDRTALTFEFAEPDFRYLTHPDWTDLGEEPHTDRWPNPGRPGWYKLWEFDLHGPLVEDYRIEGNIIYYVYFYCSIPHVAPFRFYIYDVDLSGSTSPVLVHMDRFTIRLYPFSPPRPIVLEGETVRPYTFRSGHTIRITIYVFDDGLRRRVYCFDYDSRNKHSYADFPGVVVEERMLLSMLPTLIALLVEVRRRDGDGW
jgi:exosortase/archaeosortase family protein